MWQIVFTITRKIKDIYILYRGVHYCRMAYKVAQKQLRKKKMTFKTVKITAATVFRLLMSVGTKQFETPCKFSCCAVDVVEKLTVPVPSSV
jgi:hypothetical protein